MVFEIDNVELYFNKKTILNGVYLKAQTNTITGILGRNGCGKSCLLSIIFGSLSSKYALIRINNKPITKALYLTNQVAFLPQFNFTPNQININKLFKLYKASWKDFEANFPEFKTYKSKKINYLSGGERRVIEIYLILNTPSNLILLDEPFSNISPIYIEKIKQIIKRVNKTKAIVLTDHSYNEVIDIADQIYLLKNGCTKLINHIKELESYNYLSFGTL